MEVNPSEKCFLPLKCLVFELKHPGSFLQVAWDTKWLINPDEYNMVIKGTRTLQMPSELGRRVTPHAVQPRAGWAGVTGDQAQPGVSSTLSAVRTLVRVMDLHLYNFKDP